MNETYARCISKCNIPCERTMYEPQIYSALLSKYNIDRVALTNAQKKELTQKKFLHARDLSQRAIDSIWEKDYKVIDEAKDATSALYNLLEKYTNSFQVMSESSDFEGITNIFHSPKGLTLTDTKVIKQKILVERKRYYNQLEDAPNVSPMYALLEQIEKYVDNDGLLDSIDTCTEEWQREVVPPSNNYVLRSEDSLVAMCGDTSSGEQSNNPKEMTPNARQVPKASKQTNGEHSNDENEVARIDLNGHTPHKRTKRDGNHAGGDKEKKAHRKKKKETIGISTRRASFSKRYQYSEPATIKAMNSTFYLRFTSSMSSSGYPHTHNEENRQVDTLFPPQLHPPPPPLPPPPNPYPVQGSSISFPSSDPVYHSSPGGFFSDLSKPSYPGFTSPHPPPYYPPHQPYSNSYQYPYPYSTFKTPHPPPHYNPPHRPHRPLPPHRPPPPSYPIYPPYDSPYQNSNDHLPHQDYSSYREASSDYPYSSGSSSHLLSYPSGYDSSQPNDPYSSPWYELSDQGLSSHYSYSSSNTSNFEFSESSFYSYPPTQEPSSTLAWQESSQASTGANLQSYPLNISSGSPSFETSTDADTPSASESFPSSGDYSTFTQPFSSDISSYSYPTKPPYSSAASSSSSSSVDSAGYSHSGPLSSSSSYSSIPTSSSAPSLSTGTADSSSYTIYSSSISSMPSIVSDPWGMSSSTPPVLSNDVQYTTPDTTLGIPYITTTATTTAATTTAATTTTAPPTPSSDTATCPTFSIPTTEVPIVAEIDPSCITVHTAKGSYNLAYYNTDENYTDMDSYFEDYEDYDYDYCIDGDCQNNLEDESSGSGGGDEGGEGEQDLSWAYDPSQTSTEAPARVTPMPGLTGQCNYTKSLVCEIVRALKTQYHKKTYDSIVGFRSWYTKSIREIFWSEDSTAAVSNSILHKNCELELAKLDNVKPFLETLLGESEIITTAVEPLALATGLKALVKNIRESKVSLKEIGGIDLSRCMWFKKYWKVPSGKQKSQAEIDVDRQVAEIDKAKGILVTQNFVSIKGHLTRIGNILNNTILPNFKLLTIYQQESIDKRTLYKRYNQVMVIKALSDITSYMEDIKANIRNMRNALESAKRKLQSSYSSFLNMAVPIITQDNLESLPLIQMARNSTSSTILNILGGIEMNLKQNMSLLILHFFKPSADVLLESKAKLPEALTNLSSVAKVVEAGLEEFNEGNKMDSKFYL